MKQDPYNKIVEYITENQNMFYRLAYSYVQNREDALDVVQNAVCKALEHYRELHNQEAVRTWFYRILVNESLKALKERSRHSASDDALDRLSYEEAGFNSQDDLYDCINRLDGATQTVIKLRFYEELPLKEIAQITGANLNTVKAKLYRGLRQLKIGIQEADL